MTLLRNLTGTTPVSDDAPNVADVFSTYLYEGTNSILTITNGVDLDGEGGMVWLKKRNSASDHCLNDTERGIFKPLSTHNTDGVNSYFVTNSVGLSSFNSNGFTLTAADGVAHNDNGADYASWTFRKAPRFFDCVTYTGSGGGQSILHDLGIAPGMVLIKRTDSSGDWGVWHRKASGASDGALILNSTAPKYPAGVAFGSTSSSIVVYDTSFPMNANQSGVSYVAYIFAHDPDGENDDGMIACGSYTGNSSTDGPEVNLGWEPQYVLIKNSGKNERWVVMDSMRGMVTGGNDPRLSPDSSDLEYAANFIEVSATGFKLKGTDGLVNLNTYTYIYMAIRAPMMVEPKSGTEVFDIDTRSNTNPNYTSNFGAVDMAMELTNITSTSWKGIHSRLTGTGRMYTNSMDTEVNPSDMAFDFSTGWRQDGSASTTNYSYMFKRAKGFMDVVTYTGTGVATDVPHSLGVVPQFYITKARDEQRNWIVYVDIPSQGGYREMLFNDAGASGNASSLGGNPTSSVLKYGTSWNENRSGWPYITYLFATLPGVSKFGTYTGTGAALNIDCGFSGGARFVMIKRTDSTGDWYIWDTDRGIVAGNDSHLSLNTTAAEVTSDDSIDPVSSGFTVNQVSATNINVSSATYIFLAIA